MTLRRPTSVVHIGNTPMGGAYPIRIQSMATVSTMDTDAAVAQAIRMIEAGAEYVRFTAQGAREALNLGNIRHILREKGYQTPLVADIHYNPKAADIAAEHVEKVRINPGNYVDKAKSFKQIDYTDGEYAAEIQKIRKRFIPFLERCRTYRTAVRIGVNHGSLSDRIMSRYGDTPEGMVESCMEFLRICKEVEFEDVVISIKSSNTVLMVRTVRLLVQMMQAEGMNYPLHLGVTEAGDDEDGRIKSAVGIGSLLVDGIGDTIRVSLSEPPENEIPVARKIVEYACGSVDDASSINVPGKFCEVNKTSPYPLQRGTVRTYPPPEETETVSPNNCNSQTECTYPPPEGAGGGLRPITLTGFQTLLGFHPPIVISDRRNGDFTIDSMNSPDYLYIGSETHNLCDISIPVLIDFDHWKNKPNTFPYFPAGTSTQMTQIIADKKSKNLRKSIQSASSACQKFLELTNSDLDDDILEILRKDPTIAIVLKAEPTNFIQETRLFIHRLKGAECESPVILRCDYHESDKENLQIKAAIDFGSLLIDGIGNGLFLCNKETEPCLADRTMFGILQATRARISKTEYISCPGCGRTLFDLQTTVARVKNATSHLKRLKIGIMGCIVNGPGEMADADYGYVGAGRGRISLYKGKICVKENIPEDDAVDQLVALIKANGDWEFQKRP